LIDALRSEGTDRNELVEMVARVCGERGFGRLLAWLLLSGRAGKLPVPTDQPLKQLADAAQLLRSRLGQDAKYADTLFEVQLIATVLLGDALFGDAIRHASGIRLSRHAAREFRERFTRLLPR
jgi:hypothetical protein